MGSVDRDRIGGIHVELARLERRRDAMIARHILAISIDDDLTAGLGYHYADKVRDAALTVRLDEDVEYQGVVSRIDILEGERMEIADRFAGGFDGEFGYN